MLTKRVIVCLDVENGLIVRGTNVQGLADPGDPAAFASTYERDGADEIVLLEIASVERRSTGNDDVRRVAEQLFVPLSVGGGVRSVNDAAVILRSGADKVMVNTAAVTRPELLTEIAQRFGAPRVVARIDAKMERRGWGNRWRVYTHGGRTTTALDAVRWARECADRGAGEILLTSIDRDGARTGYDLELVQAVSASVSPPVIAFGGAGTPSDVVAALRAGADAALVTGIVHEGTTTVREIKAAMQDANLPVRQVDEHTSIAGAR